MDTGSKKTYSYPRKGRYSRRKSSWSLINGILSVLAVAALCIAGKVLWDSVQEIGGLLTASTEPSAVTILDTTPPVLSGVRDLAVYRGDTVSYLRGVSAADEFDPAPSVTADSGGVDLSSPGTYEVIYTAADAAGNISRATATITVLEKQEGFTDLETIYTAADEMLENLLWDNAPAQEQVYAIYRWARKTLSYGGHSDRTDWRQTAYTMLTDGRGDCFGFFAVTKLLFERLAIPNIDVCKVPNDEEDSDHFWSLVSVDGGETYYHFDSTPRYGGGDDFCLVTDAFLDTYSASHDNSHNRDTSLYPATPEEGL